MKTNKIGTPHSDVTPPTPFAGMARHLWTTLAATLLVLNLSNSHAVATTDAALTFSPGGDSDSGKGDSDSDSDSDSDKDEEGDGNKEPTGGENGSTGDDPCASGQTTIGNDLVEFLGMKYDFPVADQSTWFYAITSGGRPAISHTVFGLEDCIEGNDILDAGTWNGSDFGALNSGDGNIVPSLPADPQQQSPTGISGIKFDQSFTRDQTRYYYITVAGNRMSDAIKVATKAGVGSMKVTFADHCVNLWMRLAIWSGATETTMGFRIPMKPASLAFASTYTPAIS